MHRMLGVIRQFPIPDLSLQLNQPAIQEARESQESDSEPSRRQGSQYKMLVSEFKKT